MRERLSSRSQVMLKTRSPSCFQTATRFFSKRRDACSKTTPSMGTGKDLAPLSPRAYMSETFLLVVSELRIEGEIARMSSLVG